MPVAEHPNQIAVRENGGLRVELAYLPIMEMTLVVASMNDKQYAVTVPAEKALDAFHHPVMYLNPAQVADLFEPQPSYGEDGA